MRKLFVVGLISVVVLIAWFLFLNHDMKSFESEFSIGPQQGSNNGLNQAFVQNENTHEPLKKGGTYLQTTEVRESINLQNNIKTDIVADKAETASDIVQINPQQTLIETAISPKLMQIFTRYGPLNMEIDKLNLELTPLQEQYSSLSDRRREIHDQLGEGNLNRATVNALYVELNEINEWSDGNVSRIFELQDEVGKIREEQLNLLEEYGFSSLEEFLIPHGETYLKWYSGHDNK